MSNRIKEILLLLGIIIIATISVGLIMSFPKFSFVGGSDEGWLGYWGSIVGVVGAYFVLSIQIKKDKKEAKIQSIDNTFFNLLEMYRNISIDKEAKFIQLHCELENKKKEKDLEKIKQLRLSLINEKKDDIMLIIENLPKVTSGNRLPFEYSFFEKNFECKEIQNFLYKNIFDDILYDEIRFNDLTSLLYSQKSYYIGIDIDLSQGELNIEHVAKQNKKRIKEVEKDVESIKNAREKKEDTVDVAFDIDNYIKNQKETIKEKLKHIGNEKLVISYSDDEIKNIILETFQGYKVELGHYFRLFYRIIKYVNINKEIIGLEQKKNYIGFLRATTDEKTMALLFYNAYYTPYGEKMKIEFKKNSFFGDSENFQNKQNDYFSKGTLLWENETNCNNDIQIMKKLTNLE